MSFFLCLEGDLACLWLSTNVNNKKYKTTKKNKNKKKSRTQTRDSPVLHPPPAEIHSQFRQLGCAPSLQRDGGTGQRGGSGRGQKKAMEIYQLKSPEWLRTNSLHFKSSNFSHADFSLDFGRLKDECIWQLGRQSWIHTDRKKGGHGMEVEKRLGTQEDKKKWKKNFPTHLCGAAMPTSKP